MSRFEVYKCDRVDRGFVLKIALDIDVTKTLKKMYSFAFFDIAALVRLIAQASVNSSCKNIKINFHLNTCLV